MLLPYLRVVHLVERRGFESEEQRRKLARLVAVRSRHCIVVVGHMEFVVRNYCSLVMVEVLLLVWEQGHQSHRMIHRDLHCCFGRRA